MFIVTSRENQFKYSSSVEQMNTRCYIHRLKYCTGKNKLTTTTHDIDESHKYNVERKKLVTREPILSDFIYVKFKAKQNAALVFQVRITVPLRSKKEVAPGRGVRWALGAGTLLFLDLHVGTWVCFLCNNSLKVYALFCRYALLKKRRKGLSKEMRREG